MMNDYVVYGIGFLAQLLFGSRMIIQWIQSEKAGHVVSPSLFWKTSLIASALFLIYGLLRQDIVIIGGQTVAYFIYIRNLQLKGEWKELALLSRIGFFILPVAILVFSFSLRIHTQALIITSASEYFALLIGGAGQLLLNLRFVYQWFVSEKSGFSHLPLGFWILSAAGSLLVITYSLFRFDPVLFVAQVMGIVVYTRNIVLFFRSPENSRYHGA
jgi:lipid-A-disaccharide synthase-like uncharacterized protein